VTVLLVTCAGKVTVQVSDTGPGVPEELGARIFSDGFTAKTGDQRRHRGIGLALAHRLVTRAGGTITVDCSGATTFTVVAPSAHQPDPTSAADAGDAPGRVEVGT
jgi:two-component system, CitB family, sensor kinase